MPETHKLNDEQPLRYLGYGNLYQLFGSASAPSPNGCAHISSASEARETGSRCAHTSPAKARARTDSKCAHTSSKRARLPYRQLGRYRHRYFGGRRMYCKRADCLSCVGAYLDEARAINGVRNMGYGFLFAVVHHLSPLASSALNSEIAGVMRSARWRRSGYSGLRFWCAFERHARGDVHLNLLANFEASEIDRVQARVGVDLFCRLLHERLARQNMVTASFSPETVVVQSGNNLAAKASGVLYPHKLVFASTKERGYLLGMNNGRTAAYVQRGFWRQLKTKSRAAAYFRRERAKVRDSFSELFPDYPLQDGGFISSGLYQHYREHGLSAVQAVLDKIREVRAATDLGDTYRDNLIDRLHGGTLSVDEASDSLARVRYWRGKVFSGLVKAGVDEQRCRQLLSPFSSAYDFKFLCHVAKQNKGLDLAVLDEVRSNVLLHSSIADTPLNTDSQRVSRLLSSLTNVPLPEETTHGMKTDLLLIRESDLRDKLSAELARHSKQKASLQRYCDSLQRLDCARARLSGRSSPRTPMPAASDSPPAMPAPARAASQLAGRIAALEQAVAAAGEMNEKLGRCVGAARADYRRLLTAIFDETYCLDLGAEDTRFLLSRLGLSSREVETYFDLGYGPIIDF